MNQHHPLETWRDDLHWVSVFARGAIGSLLLSAGIMKWPGGVAATTDYYASLFQNSLLPDLLVRAHASVILFVEILLGAWLLSGYRLGWAWRASALVLVSLAVGMLFAGKYDTASDNYLYVFLALGGLLTSRFDRWAWGATRAQAERMRIYPQPNAAELG